MEDSVTTFETHLTAVMDSLIRASVCEITKLFQETVNDYLVEISLNRKENDALKLRLRLTENKLRNEQKYGMGWAANRRNAGLLVTEEVTRKKRKLDVPRAKLKQGPSAAYGEDWPGGVWEEEGGGAVGLVATTAMAAAAAAAGAGAGGGGGGGKEAREMYLIQFPGEEEEEEGIVLEEEGEDSLAGEGEETSNIKEELTVLEGYQPASLRLIKEALKMDLPHHNRHARSRDQSEGDISLSPESMRQHEAEEGDWELESPLSEPSEGGMSVEELRGLETALKAERGREQATLSGTKPVGTVPEILPGSARSLAPKYIGLDGLEQDGEQDEDLEPQPPTLEREDTLKVKEGQREELRSGLRKRLKQEDLAVAADRVAVKEACESQEQLPYVSAPGSVEDSGGEDESTSDLLHFCPQCGGGFGSMAELEEHPCPLGGAHGDAEETPFPCASCGNSFSHDWALKNHECACAAERPHCCELCGKRFTHSRSLERHQLVHTGERPHRCPQCGRSFSRLGNLERHQRIHTGERPYGCEACGKRFSRVEYLKRHQLIHSSDRTAHQCSQCGKSFSEAESLKNHQCFYNI